MENLFDRLPDELLLIVFGRLGLFNLANCRSVCKRFWFLLRNIRKDELMIINSQALVDTWFYTDHLVNYEDCLFQDHAFKVLKSPVVDLRFLRQLKISHAGNVRGTKKDKFELVTLNDFVHLKQLEIQLNNYRSDEVISLPNLEILSLDLTDSKFGEIVAPKLHALKRSCYYTNAVLETIKFRWPDTVRQLEIDEPDRDLKLFKNVEIFKSSYEHVRNVMNLFPKLCEVHFYCIQSEIYLDHLYSIETEIQQLKEKRRAFEKPELRMFFFGVELVDDKSLADYNFGQRLFSLHMNNYSNLAQRLPWFNKLHYADLSDHLASLPASFFSRYLNIQIVNAENVGNQQEFINFLGNLKNLNSLYLRNTSSLDQQFYSDFLPTISSLIQLSIDENQVVGLNLDFIYELKLLQRFSTDQPMSIKQMLSAFVELNFFKRIFVENQGESFLIFKENGLCSFRNYEISRDPDKINVLKHSKEFKMKKLKEIYDSDLDIKGINSICGWLSLMKSFIKK